MHINSFTELNELNEQTREFSEPSRVLILDSFETMLMNRFLNKKMLSRVPKPFAIPCHTSYSFHYFKFSIVGENSCACISFGHNDVRFCPL